MTVHYPPVGIAHIINNLSDLFKDRIANAENIQIACISQPKSAPHFGTMIVIFCAFALAKKLEKEFKLNTSVLLDSLENAPAKEVEINSDAYTVCLSHHFVGDTNVAESNLESVTKIADWVSDQSDISYMTRTYKEIQSQKVFREGISKILTNPSDFMPMMSPSEDRFRIRPMCPKCGIVDKRAKTVTYDNVDSPTVISFICPTHGKIEASLDNPFDLLDCNTPIRTVLRSVGFINDKKMTGKETIIINGGDWAGAWMQRVYFDSLANFNFKGKEIPFNIFTPQITDWSGAKLSKTIYLEENAYNDIDQAWLNVPAYMEKYGEAGMSSLWSEIESWIDSPERFFRNYSLDYIKSVIER